MEAYRGDGTPFRHRRIRLGSGNGAVIICLVGDRVVMVRQPRPAVGAGSSLELPRGGTKDDSFDEALRELTEETGVGCADVRYMTLLGRVNPDTGIFANRVAVWLVHADPRMLATGAEWESGATAELMPLRDVLDDESITCGMTLAALALLSRHLRRTQPHRLRSATLRLVPPSGGHLGQVTADPDSPDGLICATDPGIDPATLHQLLGEVLDWAASAGANVVTLTNEAGLDPAQLTDTMATVERNRTSCFQLAKAS